MLSKVLVARHELAAGAAAMSRKFPLHPPHPERNCWGCDKYCPAHEMQCGNGSDRTQHPMEIFGDDWDTWGLDPVLPAGTAPADKPRFIIPLAPATD
jgi:hypothetical protein